MTDKTIDTWGQWLEAVEEKRQAFNRSKALAGETRNLVEQLEHAACYQAHKAAAYTGASLGENPDADARRTVLSRLRQRIEQANRSRHKERHHSEMEQVASDLKAREQELADAHQQLKDHNAMRDRAAAELAEVEAQQPKASNAALDTLASEFDKAEVERQRIEQALASMVDTGSAADLAMQEANEAQCALDDLEADAALGEANESEQRAATAALAKARKMADKAQQDANRQASVCRGLERRLTDATEKVAGLRKVRDAAAELVYMAELAEAERRLISLTIESEELADALSRINGLRSRLEEVQPGVTYRRASLEVRMPALYAHPDCEHLDRRQMELGAE